MSKLQFAKWKSRYYAPWPREGDLVCPRNGPNMKIDKVVRLCFNVIYVRSGDHHFLTYAHSPTYIMSKGQKIEFGTIGYTRFSIAPRRAMDVTIFDRVTESKRSVTTSPVKQVKKDFNHIPGLCKITTHSGSVYFVMT